jgi:uncharacterized damage-inducible protein DinB
MAIERVEPASGLEERSMLEAWLEYHRATLAVKCDGLSPEQLKERSVPPAKLSLLGLVRHMADVERNWFRRVLGGKEAPGLFWTPENEDGDFDDVDTADVHEAFAAWAAEIENARTVAAAAADLDVTGKRRGADVTLRWIYVHMVEEYARHNGHADLLRERIDGVTGE